MPSLQANYSLIALDISDDTIPDETYPANKHFSPGLENVGRNVTNLKSLSLYEPLIPFSVLFDSNPFLQHLDIVLEREESFNDLFNILCNNNTVVALRVRYDFSLLCDDMGRSLQLMLSSNRTLYTMSGDQRNTFVFRYYSCQTPDCWSERE